MDGRGRGVGGLGFRYVRTHMTDYMGFIDPPESVSGMLHAVEVTPSF